MFVTGPVSYTCLFVGKIRWGTFSQIRCFYNSSGQFSLLQILEFAVFRLSNNMLSTRETENFVRWLIAQKHNELFVSFLRNKMPTVHACATGILISALWIGDVNFLQLLINSGIDTS